MITQGWIYLAVFVQMVFRNNINSCEVSDAAQDNYHRVNMVGKAVIVLFCIFQVS